MSETRLSRVLRWKSFLTLLDGTEALAHDIRSPLTALNGLVEDLESGVRVEKADVQDARAALQKILKLLRQSPSTPRSNDHSQLCTLDPSVQLLLSASVRQAEYDELIPAFNLVTRICLPALKQVFAEDINPSCPLKLEISEDGSGIALVFSKQNSLDNASRRKAITLEAVAHPQHRAMLAILMTTLDITVYTIGH